MTLKCEDNVIERQATIGSLSFIKCALSVVSNEFAQIQGSIYDRVQCRVSHVFSMKLVDN